MPVYEYQCAACKREFEYEHRMSDPSKTVCEACGGALERLISRTSFAFKGGGWYKDLYASSKPGSDSASGGSSPAATPAPSTSSDAGSGSGSGSSGSSGSGSAAAS